MVRDADGRDAVFERAEDLALDDFALDGLVAEDLAVDDLIDEDLTVLTDDLTDAEGDAAALALDALAVVGFAGRAAARLAVEDGCRDAAVFLAFGLGGMRRRTP